MPSRPFRSNTLSNHLDSDGGNEGSWVFEANKVEKLNWGLFLLLVYCLTCKGQSQRFEAPSCNIFYSQDYILFQGTPLHFLNFDKSTREYGTTV